MQQTARSSKSPGGSATPNGATAKPKAGSSLMKYDLSVISREEFDTIHTFVQAVFDEGRQRFSPTLMTVSTNIKDFPPVHQAHLAKCDSLGVAMSDFDKAKDEFHLWMTPSYKLPAFRFYMTLAHELTHGYAGLQYGHSAHWRRWFYRVLSHLVIAKMIPKPASPINMLLFSVESCYNHAGGDLFALPVEATAKVNEEHDRVMQNYWERIGA